MEKWWKNSSEWLKLAPPSWLIIGIVSSGLTLAGSWLWQTVYFPHLRSRVLYARQFIVPDADGNPLILLGLSNENTPVVRVWGLDHKQRAELGVEKDGKSVLWLFDEHMGKEKPRVALGVEENDTVNLRLYDVNGNETVSLGTDDQSAALELGVPSNTQTYPILISAQSAAGNQQDSTRAAWLSVGDAQHRSEILLRMQEDEANPQTTSYIPQLFFHYKETGNGRDVWVPLVDLGRPITKPSQAALNH